MTWVESISVVIPVYRSEESLPELTAALAAALPAISARYEVIFVNDSSPDDSWTVIERLRREYPWVRGIHMMRNYGQHNALLCGIRSARHDIIVTMDDDLQHPPNAIPVLLETLNQGHDVVYGSPEREQHGLLRDLASQVTKLALQGSMGVNIARRVSAFRVFRTRLREAFATYRSPYVNIDVLLTWGTTRFAAVTVRHVPRKYGQSTYTLRKLITHALNMITGFSVLPLQFASLLGFAFAGFGALVLVYVIGRSLLEGIVVPGFAFLASTVAIFAGVQLFALGIIGEYLARIHFRTMDRPSYTVRETTDDAPEQDNP
ncbi:MAG: glycosyltransferase family 2 protein [bacterium]|nr:glycosyltransferase family 2 protein [bacterium]